MKTEFLINPASVTEEPKTFRELRELVRQLQSELPLHDGHDLHVTPQLHKLIVERCGGGDKSPDHRVIAAFAGVRVIPDLPAESPVNHKWLPTRRPPGWALEGVPSRIARAGGAE